MKRHSLKTFALRATPEEREKSLQKAWSTAAIHLLFLPWIAFYAMGRYEADTHLATGRYLDLGAAASLIAIGSNCLGFLAVCIGRKGMSFGIYLALAFLNCLCLCVFMTFKHLA